MNKASEKSILLYLIFSFQIKLVSPKQDTSICFLTPTSYSFSATSFGYTELTSFTITGLPIPLMFQCFKIPKIPISFKHNYF